MTLDEFDQFCASLPNTTRVVQWGDAHVWKIGGKVFAVGGWTTTRRNAEEQDSAGQIGVSFKCTPEIFRLYQNEPGLRPAPYLASRGLSWLQWTSPETLSSSVLQEYLWQSYGLVFAGLSKTKQRELG